MNDLRALVVDDSKVGRLTMMKKLEAMGVTVSLAESGQQALDYLARHRPDVVFMDHMMPDMDGLEVTRRIKASPATRDLPVLVVSGNDDEAFFREARAAGAIDAIAKPPANEVLETLLASLPKRVVEAAAEPAPQPVAVEPAPAPSVDMAEVHALVERLVGAAVAPLRDDFMAELRRDAVDAETLGHPLRALEQRLVPLEAEAGRPQPNFDALRANKEQRIAASLAELQARVNDDAARAEQRAGGWDSRLDTFSEDLGRVAHDVQSLRSAVPVREGVGEVTSGVLQAIQADVDRLKGKVKTLATMTVIGGAVLLAVIGAVLLWG
jgi:CheY-like chemotaxis protein